MVKALSSTFPSRWDLETETFLGPAEAAASMVTLAVIWLALSAGGSCLTDTPEPKPRRSLVSRLLPLIVTSRLLALVALVRRHGTHLRGQFPIVQDGATVSGNENVEG